MTNIVHDSFHWKCLYTWKASAYNTMWCLIGCSIGDFGTILYFQYTNTQWPVISIMILAIINGLITSFILETIILYQQMNFINSLNTALKMSLISMISMEITMNTVDVIISGKAELNIITIPLMLISGFITPLPYNYWRLKKYNIKCH